jgi:hypothetical protein
MLWEKKIQLARETQAALDPNVGATELRDMEQEIHRMKLRQGQLVKLQEKLILEMERAIYRHGDISDKASRIKTGGGKSTFNSAQHAIEKELGELNRRIKKLLLDLKEHNVESTRLLEAQKHVTKQIHCTEESQRKLEERHVELEKESFQKAEQRIVRLYNINSLQTRARRYLDLKNSKYVLAVKEADARQTELEKQRERTKKILEVARGLQMDFGGSIEAAFHENGLSGFLQGLMG